MTQTREPPKENFDSSEKIFCNIAKYKWRPETIFKNGAYSEKPYE